MNISDYQKPYLLDSKSFETIYRDIKEEQFSGKYPPTTGQKIAIFTAGQPGSGKTTLKNELLGTDRQKYFIEINTDEVRKYHPQYIALLSDPENFARAGWLVNPDSVKWCSRLASEATQKEYSLLFDMTFAGNVEGYLDMMKKHKEKGYRNELQILAVNPHISRLGIHLRYETQVNNEGYGRFVSMQSHDTNFENLNYNILKAVESGLLDSVGIYSRKIYRTPEGNIANNAIQLIHEDNRSGKLMDSQKIIASISKEQNRSFSQLEREYLSHRSKQVEDLIKSRNGDPFKFNKNMQGLKEILSTKGPSIQNFNKRKL